MDEEKAVAIWREIKSIPAAVDRLRTGASGEPLSHRVLVPAKNLSGKHIAELLKIADAHQAAVGVIVLAGDPAMVLS